MSWTAEESTVIELKLDGVGRLGETLAARDGLRAHVFGGISGERVLAEVVRGYRGHVAGRVLEVMEASPQRVEAPCPYFGLCTGCQWQHISYEHQLELKRESVRRAMEQAGVAGPPVAAVVPSPETLGYRNHARFTVGPEGTLGFVNRDTRDFVRVDRCLLMHDWINRALSSLQGNCGETTQIGIRYGLNTGEWLLQPALKAAVPLESGQKWYQEALLGRRFRISGASFFQVNTAQAEHMAQLVCDRLGLAGREVAVDAYAGVGTFAALMAPFADSVVAIEDSGPAIKDAEVNVRGLPNVKLILGRTERMLGTLPHTPDALVLDPPRVGCHPEALHAVMRQPPSRLVYVSCDPWALARDLQVLLKGPFALEELLPMDLFPQTHHVECLATLSRDPHRYWSFRSRQQIVLASESPRRQEIMSAMGIGYRAISSQVEEQPSSCSDPAAVAVERALQKARAVASTLAEGTVVGADTVVAHGEDILGKPASEAEAGDFLRRLRGREHRVITGLAVVDAATGEEVTGYRRSRVHMRRYTDEEIDAYVAGGDPMDKAGAYAIQDTSFDPVEWMKGCRLNVIGLPSCILLALLRRMDVYPAIDRRWVPPGNCPDCHRLARRAGGNR